MKSLKSLSDKELVNRLMKLVEKEQDILLEILPHLAEVDRRELYLPMGYGSLTDYCISHLGYCESSAWRRVRAARVIKDFPEVYGLLAKGRLTFSAVILASKVLKPTNKAELLPRLMGKSQSEIKKILVEYEPPHVIPDQVKPRIVMKPVSAESTKGHLSDAEPPDAIRPPSPDVGEIPLRSEGKKLTSVENSTPQVQQRVVEFERVYEVHFAGDEELMELMTWMKSFLSGRFPRGAGFLDVFKYAMRDVREREDLAMRAERRKQLQASRVIDHPAGREEQTKNSQDKSRKTTTGRSKNRTEKNTPDSPSIIHPAVRSRYISHSIREKVWTRDGGSCAFVGVNGRRCNSKHNLQFDHHPIPFGRGGPSTIENLRLLCAKHNQYTAAQVYGKEYIDAKRFCLQLE